MFTIDEMVNSFINSIQNTNKISVGNLGENPKFPLIIVYIGDETSVIHDMLSNELFRVWGAYKESVEFLHVKYIGENLIYRRIKNIEEPVYMDIKEDDIPYIFKDVRGEDRGFVDKNQIYVHYILNGSEIKSLSQINIWFEFISKFKNYSIRPCVSMLTILLDESTPNEISKSHIIQKELSKRIEQKSITDICHSIYLLSNDIQDGTTFSSWNKVVPNVSDIIMLSVSDMNFVKSVMYHSDSKVFFTSFNRVEKPVYQISQVVITEVTKFINDVLNKQKESVDFSLIKDRLLIENGLFNYASDYVVKHAADLLPTKEQLNYFPRLKPDQCDLSNLNENGFNKITMNSWKYYFQVIKNKLLVKNEEVLTKWKEEYYSYLLKTFDTNEKLCLCQNVSEIVRLLSDGGIIVKENIFEEAMYKLQLSLSSDENVINKVIKSSIEDLKKLVDELFFEWNKIAVNLNEQHQVNDKTITQFYGNLMKDFFSKYGDEIANKVYKCSSLSNIKSLFEEIFEMLKQKYEVFLAPFDEEIKLRLGHDDIKFSIEYIKNQMTGDKVKAYFRPNFSIEQPQQSVVLTKTGTPLHSSFLTTLNDSTSYYNTGSNQWADVIRIHVLDAKNLMKSGD